MATFNENGSGGAILTHPDATTYTYSYGFKPNLTTIASGIRLSSMTDQHWCEMIWRKKDDELKIAFFTALSAGDKTELDSVVAAEAAKDSSHGYFFHHKNPVFQVSSATWTSRGVLNLDLDNGNYRIAVGFGFAYDTANGKFNARILLDGPDYDKVTLWDMVQKADSNSLSDETPAYGYTYRTLEGGNYDVKFQIKCSNAAHTAQVEDVHIEVLSLDGVRV